MGEFEAREDVHPSAGVGISFEGADVTITYKLSNTTLTGKVCSQAMVIASPVWKRFIFPPWQQTSVSLSLTSPQVEDLSAATTNLYGPKTAEFLAPTSDTPGRHIDFTDDDGEALLIILNILHLKFKLVPLTVSSFCLLQLAKLCDQYQCTDILHPWLQPWIRNSEEQGLETLAKEHWLFIYWAFGKEEEFVKVAKELVTEAKTNEHGEYLTSQGEELPEPTPPNIIGECMPIKQMSDCMISNYWTESILIQRNKVIEDLLAVPYSFIDRFAAKKDPGRIIICKNRSCDAMIYGSLLFELQAQSIWPKVYPEAIHLSVQVFARDICGIEVDVHPYQPNFYHSMMCKTACAFTEHVAKVLGEIKDPVLESHRIHMASIRK